MRVIKNVNKMQELADRLRQDGNKIGFIPTMGFLHEGHLSLFRVAKRYSDVRVVSIFVNPTQFGPSEDFEKYPRDFTRDKKLCAYEGIDFIFYPSVEQIYHKNHKTYVFLDGLSKKLCGITRPDHFKGVTTIVTKLFNIVKPDIAVFGQKDVQQGMIIKKMVVDLNFDIKVIIAPIIREPDGLAMSSRNRYLTFNERKDAAVLYQSLQLAKRMVRQGEIDTNCIKKKMAELIQEVSSASIEYISIVDPNTLDPVDKIKKNTLIALAVYIGTTRLIDNISIY